MIIKFIDFPYVFTDTKDRILLDDIINQPRVGDRLEFNSELNLYLVYKNGYIDNECASGVCPIK